MGIKVITQAIGAGTGNLDFTDADVTTTPIAAKFTAFGRTEGTDSVGAQDVFGSIGFCAANGSRCISFTIDNGGGTNSELKSPRDDCVIFQETVVGGDAGKATFVSFLATGVRINVGTAFTSNVRVTCTLYFGDGMTAAGVATGAQGASAGANYNITGFGCDPDWICTLSHGNFVAADVNTKMAGGATGPCIGFGHSTGSVVAGVALQNGASCGGYGISGECVVNMGTGSIQHRAYFVSGVSDGVTLYNIEGTTTTRLFFLLGIQGGTWSVGESATRTDTTLFSTTGLTTAPKGGEIISANRTESTADTPTAHAKLSYGAFDYDGANINQAAHALMSEDAANPVDCANAIEYDNVLIHVQTDDTLVGSMTVPSLDADQVDWQMSDADPSAAWFGYSLNLAAPAGGGGGIPVKMHHYRHQLRH